MSNPNPLPPKVGVSGDLILCTACYPLILLNDEQRHSGHLRRDFPGCADIDLYEGDKKLLGVEEAFFLPDVPGGFLSELVFAPGDEGRRLASCPRCSRRGLVRRLRYAPDARIVRTGPRPSAYQVVER